MHLDFHWKEQKNQVHLLQLQWREVSDFFRNHDTNSNSEYTYFQEKYRANTDTNDQVKMLNYKLWELIPFGFLIESKKSL